MWALTTQSTTTTCTHHAHYITRLHHLHVMSNAQTTHVMHTSFTTDNMHTSCTLHSQKSKTYKTILTFALYVMYTSFIQHVHVIYTSLQHHVKFLWTPTPHCWHPHAHIITTSFQRHSNNMSYISCTTTCARHVMYLHHVHIMSIPCQTFKKKSNSQKIVF